jgi:hypothetical protein
MAIRMPFRSRAPSRALAAALVCAASACADLATAPESFVREAGGSVWVAVMEPAGLPTARGWLGSLPGGAPEGAAARATLAEASRVRKNGDVEGALLLEDRAAREAAAALTRAPEARLLLVALAAADEWAERAALRTEGGRFPELARAELGVRAGSERARALMAAGDTLAAAREIALVAEAARGWAPLAVALRAVRDAERRIDATPNPSANLLRARHLLRGAREGVAMGEPMRALQRATYALQLIDQEASARGR